MGELQQFVAELLEEHGAVVEPVDPEGLDVLVPPSVQRALDVPEVARFGFAAELPPDARRVGLEPDWLDRLGRLLGDHGRYARLVAAPEMPPLNAPERIVEHTVRLENATWRLIRVSPAWTRYLLVTFRCTALSDEKRDSTLRLGFNLANGSMLDGMLDRLWQRLDDYLAEPAGEAQTIPPAVACFQPTGTLSCWPSVSSACCRHASKAGLSRSSGACAGVSSATKAGFTSTMTG